jgi:hypothetical protein
MALRGVVFAFVQPSWFSTASARSNTPTRSDRPPAPSAVPRRRFGADLSGWGAVADAYFREHRATADDLPCQNQPLPWRVG